MVTTQRALRDAPLMAQLHQHEVWVLEDTRNPRGNTSMVSDKEPQKGGLYRAIAHFDAEGRLVGVPLDVKPVVAPEPGPATAKAAVQDAQHDAARDNDIAALVSLRGDVEAMMALVRERESSGSPLVLSDVLDALGNVLDTIIEVCED